MFTKTRIDVCAAVRRIRELRIRVGARGLGGEQGVSQRLVVLY